MTFMAFIHWNRKCVEECTSYFFIWNETKGIHVLLFTSIIWEESSTLNISLFVFHKRKLYMMTEFPFLDERMRRTHGCLALALQYFLFLSGSMTWPFLQHWAHTNCIFRLAGPNLRRAGGSSYGIATRQTWEISQRKMVYTHTHTHIQLVRMYKFYLGLNSSIHIPIFQWLLNNTFMCDSWNKSNQYNSYCFLSNLMSENLWDLSSSLPWSLCNIHTLSSIRLWA